MGSKAAAKQRVSTPESGCIEIRGAAQNNLKRIDLDLPLNKLTVITGPSGSGKSSLAFDTIYAEGQRRYVETFSPYMRQFLDRMDKPRVSEIRGIPPAIAIEQANPVKSSRSTVGTMTEINDYLKLLWPTRCARILPELRARGETGDGGVDHPTDSEGIRRPKRVDHILGHCAGRTRAEGVFRFSPATGLPARLSRTARWCGSIAIQR